MKKSFYTICIVLVSSLFFITSCSKDKGNIEPNIDILDLTDYFPLHIGNYWELDFLPKRTIAEVKEFDGIYYFQQNSQNDTIFYRKTYDVKVYQKTKGKDEIIRFDLNAEVG